MKIRLLIVSLVLVLPAHAAVFKSAPTPAQDAENVQVAVIPEKPPQVINPQTGEVRSLPLKTTSDRKETNSSSITNKTQ